jgi:hypothetical protein
MGPFEGGATESSALFLCAGVSSSCRGGWARPNDRPSRLNFKDSEGNLLSVIQMMG